MFEKNYLMFRSMLFFGCTLMCTARTANYNGCPNDLSVCANASKSIVRQTVYSGLLTTSSKLHEMASNPINVGRISKFRVIRFPDTVKTGDLKPNSTFRNLARMLKKLKALNKRTGSGCCETDLSVVIAPSSVTYYGKEYTTVECHESQMYQLITVGGCGSAGGCSCTRCATEDRLHYILVEDPSCKYAKFIPTSYPNHCFCVNQGR